MFWACWIQNRFRGKGLSLAFDGTGFFIQFKPAFSTERRNEKGACQWNCAVQKTALEIQGLGNTELDSLLSWNVMVRIHNVSVTIMEQRKSSSPLKNTRGFFYIVGPSVGVMDGARYPWCKSVSSVWAKLNLAKILRRDLLKGMSFMVLVTS